MPGINTPEVPEMEHAKPAEQPAIRTLDDLADAMSDTRMQVSGVSNPEQNAAQIRTATSKYGDMMLDPTLAGTSAKGYAYLGRGKNRIRVSPDLAAGSVAGVLNVVSHEVFHATKQKQPQGEVINSLADREEDKHLTTFDWVESGAEMYAEGERIGQPDDYATAERKGRTLRGNVGEGDFLEAQASGDTEGLQNRIWKEALETKKITPEVCLAQRQRVGYRLRADVEELIPMELLA